MKIEFFLENTLMDLLKTKSIDSIHVKDIIAELGICKGTFYKYYQDKYDLVVHVFENKFFHDLHAITSWEEFIIRSLTAFRRAPDIVYNAMLSGDINSIANYYERHIKKLFLAGRAERNLDVEGREIEYAVNILTRLVRETVMVWLKGGCVEAEEEVLAMIKHLMPYNVYEP